MRLVRATQHARGLALGHLVEHEVPEDLVVGPHVVRGTREGHADAPSAWAASASSAMAMRTRPLRVVAARGLSSVMVLPWGEP